VRGAGGLLDRYVLRRFVGAYGMCLFGFVALFLVVDFFSLLDNVLASAKAIEKAGYSVWPLVGEYYLTKLPLIVTTIGPFLTLFAAIATLITFGRHNELTPMIASGRSHHRVLAPVYVSAVLAVFALVATEEYVLPQAMKRNAAIENLIKGGERGDSRRPPHIRDDRTGNAFAARAWLPSQQRLVDVHAPSYHDPSGRMPDGKFDAASIAFRRNPETREVGWFPVDGTLTPFAGAHDGVLPDPVRLAPDRPIAFVVPPAEIDLLTEAGEPGLSRAELAALISRYPQKYELRMQLYTRTTRPVSGLVLLLLGLPFVTRPGQRTIAAGLGVALGTCAVYVGVDFFAQQVGNRGELLPLVAAGLAPSLFGAIGLARIDRVSG
jgi:lipopolysaccharide export LptBFGC system permease protein LptF